MRGGRARLVPGTYGDIRVTKNVSGSYQADAWYRDWDGRRRRVTASGPSKQKVIAALKEKLLNREVIGDTGAMLTAESSFGDLVALWLEDLELRNLSEGSREVYRREVKSLLAPTFSPFTLGEITTGRLDRFLKVQAGRSAARARHSKSLLNQLMNFAVRHDAIARNPVTSTTPLKAVKTDAEGVDAGGNRDDPRCRAALADRAWRPRATPGRPSSRHHRGHAWQRDPHRRSPRPPKVRCRHDRKAGHDQRDDRLPHRSDRETAGPSENDKLGPALSRSPASPRKSSEAGSYWSQANPTITCCSSPKKAPRSAPTTCAAASGRSLPTRDWPAAKSLHTRFAKPERPSSAVAPTRRAPRSSSAMATQRSPRSTTSR